MTTKEMDLKNKIKKNTTRGKVEAQEQEQLEMSETAEIISTQNKIKLANKKEDKRQKKSFPLYLESHTIKELDNICNITGYNRNELLTIVINNFLTNVELTGDEE